MPPRYLGKANAIIETIGRVAIACTDDGFQRSHSLKTIQALHYQRVCQASAR